MLKWRRIFNAKRRGPPPQPRSPQEVAAALHQLMSLVDANANPNVNALRRLANSVDPLSLSIKQMGYQLARQMAEALPRPAETRARHVGVTSSLSTQADLESDWAAHWLNELQVPLVFHRKLWELAFLLQSLHDHQLIRPGARGLGFGCGTEPLPSYFAAQGIDVTVTDLEEDRAAERGWTETGQHTTGPDSAFMGHLVSRDAFDRHVTLRHVDMNAVPDDLRGYDFCWSICALEHLGSIAAGCAFIERSLDTLRPGGLAIHTTEFNIDPHGPTVDNWPSVAFQRKHIEALIARLEARGHSVAPLDLRLGDKPLDKFIDLPPWQHDMPCEMADWIGPPVHMKLAFEGLVLTCIGLQIRKAG